MKGVNKMVDGETNQRFITIAKRGYIGNELYTFGVIQGIQIAICDYDKKYFGYDCELFCKFCIFQTFTTQERYNDFRKMVESIYPGLCDFYED